MTLEESVNLVMHAFERGSAGDIFVQKSPACTLIDLADALKNIFNYKKDNLIIGTRHGEKLYESLLSERKWQDWKTMESFLDYLLIIET